MQLIMYTPHICLNGTIENCDELISYARLDIKNTIE